MFWKIIKTLLAVFSAPFLLAFVLVLFYSFVPPLSLPVIGSALSLHETHWRWRSYSNISPNLPKMIISAEDGRFCEHDGVDWRAMEKVISRATQRGKLTRGASTIAMQTAKNLFLWPLPDLVRKPLEIPLAMWIDFTWSKRRLIEVYMNIAEWGDGVYGAEAAARYHFNKPASKLTAQEASQMAAVLPNPIKRTAGKPSKYVTLYAAAIRGRSAKTPIACLY